MAKAAEDAVYLAFLKEREGAAEGLSPLSLLFRLAKGPYDHAELVVQHGRRLVRYVVAAPTPERPQGLVFKTSTPPEGARERWDFVKFALAEERLGRLVAELEASLRRGDFFSLRCKMVSGTPQLPEFANDLLFGRQEQVVEGGKPVFCGSHIMRALHAADVLRHYPADKAGPSDLYALALRYTPAVPCLSPFPHTEQVDALGLKVSSETAGV